VNEEALAHWWGAVARAQKKKSLHVQQQKLLINLQAILKMQFAT
jgi:hypothetical protein